MKESLMDAQVYMREHDNSKDSDSSSRETLTIKDPRRHTYTDTHSGESERQRGRERDEESVRGRDLCTRTLTQTRCTIRSRLLRRSNRCFNDDEARRIFIRQQELGTGINEIIITYVYKYIYV